MTLSIVIPSHNRPDLLQLCLTSVRDHAPPGTQVIVVDDGSAGAVVSRVAAGLAGLEVIRHERSRGFAAAANRGVAAATGTVIELLNDDTQVTARWADAALRWFADPTVASVAPLVLRGTPGDGAPFIDSAGDEYDRGGFARKRGHGEPLTDRFRVPTEVFGASASTAFYRAEVLRTVGAFPEHFGAYFEDVDLAWRIGRAGFRTMFEPGSVVWHRVGSSYRTRRPLIERQSRNEERVFWRNVPAIWRAIPRHAVVLAGKAVRRAREGTLVPWVVGRMRALVEVPGMIRSRHR
ncbi:MAG TPA: glycosyltransferase family 2 protein [Gemmataceae bacterium]|nr:glycosyltransferase family 2 protein [Gemmataceae bacterium]